MLRILARIFSHIFHPFLVPTYGVLFLFWSNPFRYAQYDFKQKVGILIMTFAITFIYPSVAILVMHKLKLIGNFTLREKKDRILPYIVVLSFYIWLCYMALRMNGVPLIPNDLLFASIILGSTIGIAIAFVGNIFLKVSIHGLGVGGMVGFILFTAPYSEFNLSGILMIAVLIAGAVGTSRLILKAHEPNEVFIGFLIGLLSQFLAYLITPHFF